MMTTFDMKGDLLYDVPCTAARLKKKAPEGEGGGPGRDCPGVRAVKPRAAPAPRQTFRFGRHLPFRPRDIPGRAASALRKAVFRPAAFSPEPASAPGGCSP